MHCAASDDHRFCLENVDGKLSLKTNHQYYYQVIKLIVFFILLYTDSTHPFILQVQAQLFCTGLSYCDLIVYTKKELHVERIKIDTMFMEENLVKVKHFFEVAVLPELLGHWFSRPPERISMSSCSSASVTSPGVHQTDSQTYCYCEQGEFGKMIGCDNDSCPYQWFHLECLKLKSLPRTSKWYCPDCRKLNQKTKSTSRT